MYPDFLLFLVQTRPRNIIQTAAIDATRVINELVIGQLKQRSHVSFLLGLLNKMFALNSNRLWIINWKGRGSAINAFLIS